MSIKGKIKRFWQRRIRGWDDSEIWSLDVTHAQWILPRLQRLLEVKNGYPSEFSNPDDDMDDSGLERWRGILSKMVRAFDLIAQKWDDAEWQENAEAPEYREIEDGLVLFAKYHGNLWW